LITGCIGGGGSGSGSTSYDGAVGQLKSAADAVTSAGSEFGTSSLYAASIGENLKRSMLTSSEEQSSDIEYCSNKGRAWNESGSVVANAGEVDFAIHNIECLARVDQTTETPVGFLSQIAFIGCILEDAGVDLNVTASQTFPNITVNPATSSDTCKALTNTNIKSDDQDYTFSVNVTVAPTGWDRKVELLVGASTPFYTVLISEDSGKLAIKAAEYDSGVIDGTFDINIDQSEGALVYESVSDGNYGHARLRLAGTINSSWEFTSVSSVQGVSIVCNDTNGCNGGSGSYEGSTVNGTLDALAYEAIRVSGSTCDLGTGCSAATGTDCSAGTCLTYGSHTTNTFANDEDFGNDMDDLTSGPICFSSVGVATAPTRSTLAACTL
jgi:hypothetical protein